MAIIATQPTIRCTYSMISNDPSKAEQLFVSISIPRKDKENNIGRRR